LNSNNSPPLDLIKLSSEEPFTFPWILRRLGPTRFSIFYADLGADQNFPHSYLVGYRANMAPASAFEFGFSVYTKSGGHGAPLACVARIPSHRRSVLRASPVPVWPDGTRDAHRRSARPERSRCVCKRRLVRLNAASSWCSIRAGATQQ